jgi:hypothetical protein
LTDYFRFYHSVFKERILTPVLLKLYCAYLAARFQDYYKVVMLSDQLTRGVVFPGGPSFLKPELAVMAATKARSKSVAFYTAADFRKPSAMKFQLRVKQGTIS